MKKLIFTLFLTTFLCASVFTHAIQDATQIMSSVKHRDQGLDRYSDVDLIQTMSDGFVRSRSLKMYEKEFGEERKGLLYFTAPSNTAGTGLLMYSYAEVEKKDDDQWLYLPALRKVKRIATNSKEGPFLGTDFSFADIERMRLSDYLYTIKNSKENVSIIEATTESGLENPRTGYSKRIVHVDTEKNIILKDEIFRQGRLIKVFEVVKLEKVDGFWTVVEAKMDNLVEGGNTRLIRKNTQYNQKLKDGLFNQRTLRKGLD
ncbi:outer membrane lipoprotein-sorting protein [Pseudomonas sp. HK3]|jgi:outer membrane lipoprotein-sorting protein